MPWRNVARLCIEAYAERIRQPRNEHANGRGLGVVQAEIDGLGEGIARFG